MKIYKTEFTNFILRGPKGVQGLEKLKEYRIMRLQIDEVARAYVGSNIEASQDVKLILKAIEKTADVHLVEELSLTVIKLQENTLLAETEPDEDKKNELLRMLAESERKIKKFLSDAITKNPDLLKDFLSKEVNYSLEKTEEVAKSVGILMLGLELCVESLKKDPKVTEEWSAKDRQEFITLIASEPENLVDYGSIFF